MLFTKPAANQVFTVTSTPTWPSILLATDATGPHTWQWSIKWNGFSKSGTASTGGNEWDAGPAINDLGGTLTVKVAAGTKYATINVIVKGANPTELEVKAFLRTKLNSTGFDKIIAHEAKFKHFDRLNQPIKSFDNGYGMCQLTTPRPTFAQIWNWKLNVEGGLSLFAQKRGAAATYLSQSSRSYTTEQLTRETVCRWNGGSYHEWSAATGAWIRKANILCDSATGNIGWNTSDAQNVGKTEAALRSRDKGGYSSAPGANAHWGYFGVCYADKLLA